MALSQLAANVAAAEAAAGQQQTKEDKAAPGADNSAMAPYWAKVDALRGGAESMIAAGEKYLPKFPGEEKTQFEFRLSLSKLTNIYDDLVTSLAAKPFEEEISLADSDNLPKEIQEFVENVDGMGNNLTKFASSVFLEGIHKAIDWIFVDYPAIDASRPITIAEGRSLNIRPFWSRIDPVNMLEVRSKFVNSKEVLTYARILEPGKPLRVREFLRDDSGKITWNLWEKIEKTQEWIIAEDGVISIDVIPLVPFTVVKREGTSWQFKPPMRNAVDLQLILYRQESALEFTKTMAAYPMLSGNGIKPPIEANGKTPKRLAVGPHVVLYAPPDGNGNSGSWSYVEPGASSLTFLASDIKQTKEDLRELGKQPLTAQSGNITTITAGIAAGKGRSAVKAWGLSLKDAIENALVISAKWQNLDYDPEVMVYDDYDNFTEGDIEALNIARANKDISRETYLSELKRRFILSAEFDFEDEAEKLLGETPGELINDGSLTDPEA